MENITKSVQCLKCGNKYTSRALLLKHSRWHKRIENKDKIKRFKEVKQGRRLIVGELNMNKQEKIENILLMEIQDLRDKGRISLKKADLLIELIDRLVINDVKVK